MVWSKFIQLVLKELLKLILRFFKWLLEPIL